MSRLMLFGEVALHHALREYMAHYHRERNHHGKSLAPQAQVDITLEQYADEDAHLYVQPPQGMTAEDVERLELTVRERCNNILLDTGLFIVNAVSG